jgi:hypothetical protein
MIYPFQNQHSTDELYQLNADLKIYQMKEKRADIYQDQDSA